MIRTTININSKILMDITSASEKHMVSRRDIITGLLMRMMNDIEKHGTSFRTIQYQEDDKGKNWHCFHICFREDEYEFFSGLRFLCKISLSCLLAMAVHTYIYEYQTDGISVDNYIHHRNYVLHGEIVNDIFYWRILWGYEEQEVKKLKIPIDNRIHYL